MSMPLNITQFTIGSSRTINLGNFESLRVEASITIEVGDTDYARTAQDAQIELRQLLEDTYRAQAKKREKPLNQPQTGEQRNGPRPDHQP
jgi:hypothetical protein